MMKHKATALPMYNDETITMLRASEDVRDSSRFRTFCDTGMTWFGLENRFRNLAHGIDHLNDFWCIRYVVPYG